MKKQDELNEIKLKIETWSMKRYNNLYKGYSDFYNVIDDDLQVSITAFAKTLNYSVLDYIVYVMPVNGKDRCIQLLNRLVAL